jgi:predicted DNA-binding ribbon-helix-helix protein
MKSTVVKRSIVIAGHKTSVSLEDEFWKGLKVIAVERDMKLWQLVTSIDSDRQHHNLSSALRLFVLKHYRNVLDDEGRVWTAGPNGAALDSQRMAKHIRPAGPKSDSI